MCSYSRTKGDKSKLNEKCDNSFLLLTLNQVGLSGFSDQKNTREVIFSQVTVL